MVISKSLKIINQDLKKKIFEMETMFLELKNEVEQNERREYLRFEELRAEIKALRCEIREVKDEQSRTNKTKE